MEERKKVWILGAFGIDAQKALVACCTKLILIKPNSLR